MGCGGWRVHCNGEETSAQSPAPVSIVARTASGLVSRIVSNGVSVFHAIPDAAPPVGALRFEAPGNPAPWQGVRDCTRIGPGAPQGASRLDGVMGRLAALRTERRLPHSLGLDARPGFSATSGVRLASRRRLFHRWWRPAVYSGSMLARTGDIVVVVVNNRRKACYLLNFAKNSLFSGENQVRPVRTGLRTPPPSLPKPQDSRTTPHRRFYGDSGRLLPGFPSLQALVAAIPHPGLVCSSA
jgi:hypothetical protein